VVDSKEVELKEVAGVLGGGDELDPPLLGYPVAAVESAGKGPDGTAGRI